MSPPLEFCKAEGLLLVLHALSLAEVEAVVKWHVVLLLVLIGGFVLGTDGV